MFMFGKRRKHHAVRLPFSEAEYDLTISRFRLLILDAEFDVNPSEDPEAYQAIQQFVSDGIWDFHDLSERTGPTPTEITLGHDVAKAIIDAANTTMDNSLDLSEGMIDMLMAQRVPLDVPVARGNPKVAVNRAEQAVLNATCCTYLSFLFSEHPGALTREKLEAIAQCIGLIWVQWFFWARPLFWSAFQERNSSS